MKAKVISLKAKLVGESVPPKTHGAAGRDIENQLRAQGFPISNQPGPDLPSVGLEVKSRDIDSTSAQSVGTMLQCGIFVSQIHAQVIREPLVAGQDGQHRGLTNRLCALKHQHVVDLAAGFEYSRHCADEKFRANLFDVGGMLRRVCIGIFDQPGV